MPHSMTMIDHSLKELRLFGMQETLEARSLQVQEGKMSFLEGLSVLLQDEVDRKRSRLNERRYKSSGLAERKTKEKGLQTICRHRATDHRRFVFKKTNAN